MQRALFLAVIAAALAVLVADVSAHQYFYDTDYIVSRSVSGSVSTRTCGHTQAWGSRGVNKLRSGEKIEVKGALRGGHAAKGKMEVTFVPKAVDTTTETTGNDIFKGDTAVDLAEVAHSTGEQISTLTITIPDVESATDGTLAFWHPQYNWWGCADVRVDPRPSANFDATGAFVIPSLDAEISASSATATAAVNAGTKINSVVYDRASKTLKVDTTVSGLSGDAVVVIRGPAGSLVSGRDVVALDAGKQEVTLTEEQENHLLNGHYYLGIGATDEPGEIVLRASLRGEGDAAAAIGAELPNEVNDDDDSSSSSVLPAAAGATIGVGAVAIIASAYRKGNTKAGPRGGNNNGSMV